MSLDRFIWGNTHGITHKLGTPDHGYNGDEAGTKPNLFRDVLFFLTLPDEFYNIELKDNQSFEGGAIVMSEKAKHAQATIDNNIECSNHQSSLDERYKSEFFMILFVASCILLLTVFFIYNSINKHNDNQKLLKLESGAEQEFEKKMNALSDCFITDSDGKFSEDYRLDACDAVKDIQDYITDNENSALVVDHSNQWALINCLSSYYNLMLSVSDEIIVENIDNIISLNSSIKKMPNSIELLNDTRIYLDDIIRSNSNEK